MKTKQLKNWFAIEVIVESKAAEAIEFALNELDALGTEINNLGKPQEQKKLTVIGYFQELPDDENVRARLNAALRIYGFSSDAIEKTNWRKIEDTDWLAEWKKHWKPTETKKFIIAPGWETVKNAEKIIIRIEPNMAFGTGTHETTRLCLKAIEENYKSEMSFFDVGTGTGILAIAAAKIKLEVQSSAFGVDKTYSNSVVNFNSEFRIPNSIAACDTDENSIAIARENAKKNDVGEEIQFFVNSISAETHEFDVVCANLTLDVIKPILPLLLEKAKRVLILSGILKRQENAIVSQLKNCGVEKPKIETLGEWICVLIQNAKQTT